MRCRLLLVAAALGSLDQYVTYGRAGTPLHGVERASTCTGAGFNNRLQALQLALIVAVATNRTLLVHDFELGHNSGPAVPYSRFFEIDWPTRRAAAVPAALPVTDLPFGPSDCLASLPAPSSAPVLRYPACFGWWAAILRPEDHGAAVTALARLRLRPEWRQAAADLRPALPPAYRALHFRLGDRPGLALDCTPGPVAVRPWAHANQPTSEALARTWGWDGCPLVEMEAAFDKWAATGPVYISTNRPEDPRAVKLARRTGALRWADLPVPARERALRTVGFADGPNGAAVSLLEQLICAGADAYLPAWPSSWENLVLQERLGAGKPDAAPQIALVLASVVRRSHAVSPSRCAAAPPAALALPAAATVRRAAPGAAKPLLRR